MTPQQQVALMARVTLDETRKAHKQMREYALKVGTMMSTEEARALLTKLFEIDPARNLFLLRGVVDYGDMPAEELKGNLDCMRFVAATLAYVRPAEDAPGGPPKVG